MKYLQARKAQQNPTAPVFIQDAAAGPTATSRDTGSDALEVK